MRTDVSRQRERPRGLRDRQDDTGSASARAVGRATPFMRPTYRCDRMAESRIIGLTRLPRYRAMRTLAVLLVSSSGLCFAQAPVAPMREVTDTYFGTTVRDPSLFREHEGSRRHRVDQGAGRVRSLDARRGPRPDRACEGSHALR